MSTLYAPIDPPAPPPAEPERRAPRANAAARALVTDIVRHHGDELLRYARRRTDSGDDAHDVYQRMLELMLEHAADIDRRKALPWAHTVIAREASRLRRERVPTVPLDAERPALQTQLPTEYGPEEHVEAIDIARRAQEVLQTLPEAQAQALCLRAQGLSYDEIAGTLQWTSRKVKRAVSEGQRTFASRYRALTAGLTCDVVAADVPAYLDGSLSLRAQAQLRGHITRCPGCRSALHGQRSELALHALLPPVIPVAVERRGWLSDHLLAPIDHLLLRGSATLDQLTSVKLGAAAAASTAALAGGGVVAHQQLTPTEPPPPQIQAALTVPAAPRPVPAGTAPAASTVQDVVAAAVQREQRLREQRQAAARRRAERRRNAERQRLAASREFTPAATEFVPAPSRPGGGNTAARTTEQATAPSAVPPAAAPPQEFATAPSDDGTVEIVTEGGP